MTQRKPATVDEYLAAVRPEQRPTLEALRRAIRTTAPRAVEGLYYGLPAFRLDGKPLVGFGAARNHCAFYPLSGRAVAAHADALRDFSTSKGTIRFTPDRPLPVALVRKLVRFRMSENAESARQRS